VAGRPKLLTRRPRRTGSLDRSRIVDLAGTRPVIALCGAVGSGTSTAAAQIAESGSLPYVWCRLADGYSDARDVVEMIADVLGVKIEPQSRVLDMADQILDLIEAAPHSIVIDAYHLGTADLDRLIAEMSELAGTGVQVVVAGESRPAGLIGLLSPTHIAVLEADDLAFTNDEAISFFALHGGLADDAVRWNGAVGGSPVVLAAGAMNPTAPAAEQLGPLMTRTVEEHPEVGVVLDVAAAIPYVNEALLEVLGVDISSDRFKSLVREVSFLVQHDSYVQLSAEVAELRRNDLPTEQLAKTRKEAGEFLAISDPVTAIEVLIQAGEPESAADVLENHLSEIGVERALNWLYRLPDDLRHRFPPVLAAGRATVEVDTALAVAEARVEVAQDSYARREALYALGSVESFRGELAAAAGAFEAAMRCGADDAEFVERVSGELAGTRWLLGDIVGARASLDGARRTADTRWLAAQLEPFDGGSGNSVEQGAQDTSNALDLAALALTAVLGGDDERASEFAEAAYAHAVRSGGNDLAAAGPVRAWMLLRAGRTDEALLAAAEIERRLGPRHQLGRVHGALIRERCSRDAADTATNERDLRRLRDLRATGYGSIEQLVSLVLASPTHTDEAVAPDGQVPSGVLVTILGNHTVRVDDRVVQRSDWKSKKALAVLTVLALYGRNGARREQIIEGVWPNRPPDKGRTLLRTALSDIRRVLEPGRPPGEPSRFISTNEDRLLLDGLVDVDQVEATVGDDPIAAFALVVRGLADEVIGVDWGEGLEQRVNRLILTSAAAIPESATHEVRIEAFEALIRVEPWNRGHYDALAGLFRETNSEGSAIDVERRWFADD